MFGGKREILARGLYWSGAVHVLSQIPEREMLLVLNYHRIGDRLNDPFDPGVFSATFDEFESQIKYLKSRFHLVTLQEAQAFLDGSLQEKKPRCRVLITFDDGYLDNYLLAFPVLLKYEVQGVFFLPTSMVGTCAVPWWDHIAFVLKTARQRRFSLRYPSVVPVDIDADGLARSLDNVLSAYKSPANKEPEHFLHDLQITANGEAVPATMRRFLSWEEAREMERGGMAFGSHTHSHHVLSQLKPEHQREEFVLSLEILRKQLRSTIDSLAYPVGTTMSFSEQTQKIAEDVGFRTAFSFYGGTNARGSGTRYDVKRVGVGDQSLIRFKVQTTFCRLTGNYWP